jgi:hypothetical protein
MAVTIKDVRGVAGNALTSALTAFATNPVAGDAVVVGYSIYNTASPGLAPTDTGNNTYTQIGTMNLGGTTGVSLWLAKNIGANTGLTVTVKPNGTYFAAVGWLLTGVSANPYNGDFGKANSGSGTTASVATTGGTPVNGSLYLGFCSVPNSVSLTDNAAWNAVASGFTSGMRADGRCLENQWASFNDLWSEYLIGNGVQTPTWSWSGSNAWAAVVASFAPAGPTWNPTSLCQFPVGTLMP